MALVGICLLGGCLSLDTVPQRDPDAPAGLGQPCLDRGVFTLEGTEYRGLPDRCEGELVCVDGACDALPECEPNQASECRFTLRDTHGEVDTVLVSGRNVYWVERGSFDARKNYRRDGAIVRAELGVWTREELATGVDFWDETNAELQSTDLIVHGDHLFVTASSCCEESSYHLSLTAGSTIEPDPVGGRGCLLADTHYWVEGRSLYRRALSARDARELLAADLPAPQLQCGAVLDDAVYVRRLASILRVGMDEPHEVVQVSPSARLIGSYRGQLVARLDQAWVGTGLPEPNGKVLWLSVAGGTSGSTAHLLHGEHVYWYRNSPSGDRKHELIMRGRLDATGTQQAVAEIWDHVQSEEDRASFGIGDGWVGWWPPTGPVTALHFRPLPPDIDGDGGA